jgi:hypothetical protein
MNKQFSKELIAYFPWYDTGHIENDASNNSSIVACVFVTAVTFLPSRCLATIRGFLPSRCLTTLRGFLPGRCLATIRGFLPSRCLATIRGFLPSRCLATIGGYTDSNVFSQAYFYFFKIRTVAYKGVAKVTEMGAADWMAQSFRYRPSALHDLFIFNSLVR